MATAKKRKKRETVAERTARLLDEYIAEKDQQRLERGPDRETAPVYLLAIPVAAEKLVRAAIRKHRTSKAIEPGIHHVKGARTLHVTTRVGDHETFKAVLDELGAEPDVWLQRWTPARARRLLASLDSTRAKRGGPTKLARYLDEQMASQWIWAKPKPASVALAPLRLLTKALRSTVRTRSGFAIAMDPAY